MFHALELINSDNQIKQVCQIIKYDSTIRVFIRRRPAADLTASNVIQAGSNSERKFKKKTSANFHDDDEIFSIR